VPQERRMAEPLPAGGAPGGNLWLRLLSRF
jgi:hypothetical protein